MTSRPNARADNGPASGLRGLRRWRRRLLPVAAAGALAVLAAACADDDTAPPPAPATTQAPAPAPTPAPLAEPEPTVPPAPTPPISREEIARAFVEAASAADGAAAAASLAADAEVDLAGLSDPADAEAWFEWNRAISFLATATGCEPTASGDMLCRYTYDSSWMQAAGIDPVPGNSMTFTISDGVITSVTERFQFGRFAPLWDGFKAFVRRVHPGSLDSIVDGNDRPVLTDDALERWELYSGEYVDSFALGALGESFLDAFETYDPAALEAVAGTANDLHEELYLQAFSLGTNYAVAERSCRPAVRNVQCSITGTDDIGTVLAVTYTDSFGISVDPDGRVLSVIWATESTPAGVFDAYFEWMQTAHPEIFALGGVCEGFFDRGPTPEACGVEWAALVNAYDPAA